MKEDQAIVKFIVDNKYAFKVTGREIWVLMENSNVSYIIVFIYSKIVFYFIEY